MTESSHRSITYNLLLLHVQLRPRPNRLNPERSCSHPHRLRPRSCKGAPSTPGV